jgi:hypothetical protein
MSWEVSKMKEELRNDAKTQGTILDITAFLDKETVENTKLTIGRVREAGLMSEKEFAKTNAILSSVDFAPRPQSEDQATLKSLSVNS